MILLIQTQTNIIPNLSAGEYFLFCFAVLMCTAIILITINLLKTTNSILKALQPDDPDNMPEMQSRTFWQKLGSLKPLSMEHKLVMEHKYDGIAELDNPTPPWFMYLFYSTIAFAVIYLAGYHVLSDGKTMEKEYTEAMETGAKERELYLKKVGDKINENNVVALSDEKSLADGKKIYLQNCLACHGDNGQGGVGPNLTDEYWLHGGTIKNVFHTIAEGVPEKGMISWKKTLNPVQIQQLASYLATIVGTKPANAKEPQGTLASAETIPK